MAIYRLLKNSQLNPIEVDRIAAAYDHTLRILGVKDRDDPLTEMVAKKIIKIAQTGVHDPTDISALAIKELEIR
ncbi:hypothetical protein [Bradyrhizobium japonicum]|uniref:Uncharacterized protein n=1 Tax=Bradyrhizobium japonicum TaxID=375 RepID=A0ABV2RLF6_BRAJP|nr:hypothetical protein [Bradyrhizobium japonicum]MCP1761712.1 hypothetical protein [Bradyrhizobium japonicum]MCP1793292.1 hypothetical protein [Bradyrhizobium japonicum]MCP1805725.1 hypothetical protein [Bradyrhizobium japonicum]MCP1814742.1 hypothetical protein [Bradyrhizobium japonicum]MCP1873829.1 hypothetical protein [Bradyrhizobium japonicum]